MTNEHEKVMDALNVIDEQAEQGNSTYEENVERGKAYAIVSDFIDKYAGRENKENQKLVIPFTENDIQELGSGEEFDWTFETDRGESIDIHIKQEEYEEDEEEDENN